MLKYVNIIIHIESYMRVCVYIWQLTVLLWHIGFFLLHFNSKILNSFKQARKSAYF